MELALLAAWESGRISLPVITVDFANNNLAKAFRITTLEMPHRIADAILRDSVLDGKAFRSTDVGKRLDNVDLRNATALFELCPTALIFGMWDSTGPRGGLGAKFARALVSEIIGFDAQTGCRTSSRIDPLPIQKSAGPLYVAENQEFTKWTLDPSMAKKDGKGKPLTYKKAGAGAPSEANLGNIAPSINDNSGGVTISRALQTTVLSLPALRRLCFPLDTRRADEEVNAAARTTLAALALCAAELSREAGFDLRSRCQLIPTKKAEWELLGRAGRDPERFEFSAQQAIDLLNDALKEAKNRGLPWRQDELVLAPAPELAQLVRKSMELAAELPGED
jgi:CRISPR-associated protein Csb1